MSVSPISGLMFLLLAAGAARAEDPSGDKGLTTYAIAMHGQPALPADFSRLPYADPQATKGGHLALAYQGTFDSLNPYNLSAGSAAKGLIGNVFQSLMLRSLDEPFTLYGVIAQSIETDDARSYVIFRLDPRARFSDGVPVSAADVLFTFDLLKQEGRPQQRDAFGRVKRAEALDLMTVRFDLSGLDSEMPLALAMMPVLPKHSTDVEHFDNPTLKPPVGTGPYVIADVQPGKRLILRRNPDYWAQDLPVQRGLFNFDEIEIDYYRDADSSFEAFKAGLCDFRQETDAGRWISSYDFPAVRDGRTIKESLPYGLPKGMEGFAFNMRRSIFADVRVREALGMMFDFEWINANFYGGGHPRSRNLLEWPAPPSGVVGSPANQEEEGMDISVLGIDLGKNVCSVVGLDASGAVVMRRKVRRETLIALAEKLPPCVVGMEACCGAHHLGRVFAAHGHDVRLMSPEYVRPYIKAQKNDDRDAEGI